MRIDEMGRGKRTLLLVGVSFTLLLLLLVVLEGFVRVRAYVNNGQWWSADGDYTRHAESGLWIPRANSASHKITINSLGFRGDEIEEKEPNTLRIAFLGGSTTYCAEVSSDQHVWPAIVEKEIQKRAGALKVDHINGGVPGYSAIHSFKNLTHRIAPHDPDWIVIYHATNDLTYNSFEVAKAQGVAEARGDEEKFWLSQYSLLSHMIEWNLGVIIKRNEAAKEEPVNKADYVLDIPAMVEPFEQSFRELVQLAKSHASNVAVATFVVQLCCGTVAHSLTPASAN